MTLRSCLRGAAAILLVCAAAAAHAEDDRKDFSAAERLLFMSPQLGTVKAPATLNYSFRKSGAMEEGFEDKVGVAITLQPDGKCCIGQGSFLSGERALRMPDLEGGDGNPVTMYFLERDVREMQRLTKGSQNYFRKRIRMAIYNAATVRDVTLTYRGRSVAGQEITITPYADDANAARFAKLVGKKYQFLLSDAVPGSVYAIRTRVDGSDAAQPLLLEELLVDGAEAAATAGKP